MQQSHWQVKVGASAIAPTQDTAILGGAAVVKADQEIAFTPSVEYIFGQTPFSVELLLATPISHDVLLDGQKAVKLKHLPPTITAKYNFKNSTRFTVLHSLHGMRKLQVDLKELK